MEDNSGENKLYRIIRKIVLDLMPKGAPFVLGTILSDLSLQVDGFQIPIPTGMYYVLDWFAQPETLGDTGDATVGDHGEHHHSIPRPATMGPLVAGDRVAVAILAEEKVSSSIPVVIGRVRRT